MEYWDELEETDKLEIQDITKSLDILEKSNKEKPFVIKDKKIKERIVKICLKLIEETPSGERGIRETSYAITNNFIWYRYGDKLDELFGLIGELELPKQHVSGDVNKLWNKVKIGLKNYLKKK